MVLTGIAHVNKYLIIFMSYSINSSCITLGFPNDNGRIFGLIHLDRLVISHWVRGQIVHFVMSCMEGKLILYRL